MIPADTLLARIDRTKLYPLFQDRVVELLAECQKRGAVFYATCGYRSPEDQMAEYLKGRQTVGVNPTVARPLGDPVTWALPYYSFHQFGLAVDLTRDGDPDRPGLQPSWKNTEYAVLAECAAKLGLRSLGPSKHDWPHVEAPIEGVGLSLAMIRVAAKSAMTPVEGLRRVWTMCEEHGILLPRAA